VPMPFRGGRGNRQPPRKGIGTMRRVVYELPGRTLWRNA